MALHTLDGHGEDLHMVDNELIGAWTKHPLKSRQSHAQGRHAWHDYTQDKAIMAMIA